MFDGISRTSLKQDCAGEDRDDNNEKALQSLHKMLKTPWPSGEQQQQQIHGDVGCGVKR